jgi:hypothetical protein
MTAPRTGFRRTGGNLAAFAACWIASSVAAIAGNAMPVPQQNALVQKFCAVRHTDAEKSGGLSLEHFDAAKPDPEVAVLWPISPSQRYSEIAVVGCHVDERPNSGKLARGLR